MASKREEILKLMKDINVIYKTYKKKTSLQKINMFFFIWNFLKKTKLDENVLNDSDIKLLQKGGFTLSDSEEEKDEKQNVLKLK
jgi:hypothetical protein